MSATNSHHLFKAPCRVSQSLRNDRCQNILYKAVFEHFKELHHIAALLLASKSFQNSSFGANFIVNFAVDANSIALLESVLSPSSCFSLQFVPSLHIRQSKKISDTAKASFSYFVGELVNAKYFHSSLRSLRVETVPKEFLLFFFGNPTNFSWPQLHDLTLESVVLDDSILEMVSKTALQLRSVNLSRSSGITDVGLEHISRNLPNITSLSLVLSSMITDSSLEQVAKFSKLTNLDLYGCSAITDAGLEVISGLSNITSLNLCYCYEITDIGLQHVAQLSSLVTLNIRMCGKITDVGLERISQMSSITTLILYGCSLITDAGMENIYKFPGITTIDLRNCDKITFEARKKLKMAMPNCFVNDEV